MADDLGWDEAATVVRGTTPRATKAARLAEWIEQLRGIPVITVVDQRAYDSRRIVVWVRTDEDAAALESSTSDIADRIVDSERGHWLRPDPERPFVITKSFEAAARDVVTKQLGVDGHRAIEKLIDDPALAELVVFFHWVVFFVHTDAQKAALAETARGWEQVVLDFLSQYDEFGVLTTESFRFTLDSKETLDRDYEGSTYYYLK
jgi:hypothetical protein